MRRKTLKRKPLPKVIAICEGEVTEPTYLTGLRRERRVPKERLIIVPGAGDPNTIVSTAIQMKDSNDRANRRDGIKVEDTVWVIFDCDNHLRLGDAIKRAVASDLCIAFSNPSFELFLLYHFEYLDRDEHRKWVARRLKKYIKDYDKHFDYEAERMSELYPTAKAHSEKANRQSAMVDGINAAPYSSVYKLIDYLKNY